MSQRTISVIGGVALLLSVVAVQVARILGQPVGGRAVGELVAIPIVLVGILIAGIGGQEIVSRRRWRVAEAMRPGLEFEPVLGGMYRSEALGARVVALYLSSAELALVPLGGDGSGSARVPLSGIRAVEVETMDSPLYWGTELRVELVGAEGWSISVDGWRIRSRRRVRRLADAAAHRISAAMGSGVPDAERG